MAASRPPDPRCSSPDTVVSKDSRCPFLKRIYERRHICVLRIKGDDRSPVLIADLTVWPTIVDVPVRTRDGSGELHYRPILSLFAPMASRLILVALLLVT